ALLFAVLFGTLVSAAGCQDPARTTEGPARETALPAENVSYKCVKREMIWSDPKGCTPSEAIASEIEWRESLQANDLMDFYENPYSAFFLNRNGTDYYVKEKRLVSRSASEPEKTVLDASESVRAPQCITAGNRILMLYDDVSSGKRVIVSLDPDSGARKTLVETKLKISGEEKKYLDGTDITCLGSETDKGFYYVTVQASNVMLLEYPLSPGLSYGNTSRVWFYRFSDGRSEPVFETENRIEWIDGNQKWIVVNEFDPKNPILPITVYRLESDRIERTRIAIRSKSDKVLGWVFADDKTLQFRTSAVLISVDRSKKLIQEGYLLKLGSGVLPKDDPQSKVTKISGGYQISRYRFADQYTNALWVETHVRLPYTQQGLPGGTGYGNALSSEDCIKASEVILSALEKLREQGYFSVVKRSPSGDLFFTDLSVELCEADDFYNLHRNDSFLKDARQTVSPGKIAIFFGDLWAGFSIPTDEITEKTFYYLYVLGRDNESAEWTRLWIIPARKAGQNGNLTDEMNFELKIEDGAFRCYVEEGV
ncbi:MAG: hypothetical protein J5794_08800, partial [Lachnospiraceae bacterium]|nr:hypothetical protein [Lachnospiraceae bacterium]